jgi:hypothetical protein
MPEPIMAIAINCAAPAKTIIDIKVISKVEKPAVLPKIPQVSPKGIIPADKGRQSFNTSFHISRLGSGNVSGEFLSINYCNSFAVLSFFIIQRRNNIINIQLYNKTVQLDTKGV